jgi:hypothetical protein
MKPLFQAIRRKIRDENRLATMEARDIADFGLTPNELAGIVDLPADVADRMDRMAAVFNVSPDAPGRDRGREIDMIRTCGTCSRRKRCAKELFGSTRPDAGRCAEFCPNADEYRRLANCETA